MEIKTKEQWWKTVDDNWRYLVEILWHNLDPKSIAYKIPGNPTSDIVSGHNDYPISCCVVVEQLKESRDPDLARYFNAAWGLASESYAWSVPGWGVLCDLCSEEWVIYDDPQLDVVKGGVDYE